MADIEGMEKELAEMRKNIEADVGEASQEQGGKCPFCEIIDGNIPAKKVYEDDSTIAFLDINPRNPGHTLVVPKKHYATILDIPEKEAGELFKAVKKVSIAVQAGMKAEGISISQSNGAAAGQLVPHLHFHVIPRFMREGPMALEGILSVKKMPEQSLDKIMDTIKADFSAPKAAAPAPEKEEPEEEVEPKEKAKPKKKKKQEIDFDF